MTYKAKKNSPPSNGRHRKAKHKVFRFQPRAIATAISASLTKDLPFDLREFTLTQLYERKGAYDDIFAYRMVSEFTKKFVDPSKETNSPHHARRDRCIASFTSNVDRLSSFDPSLPKWHGGPYQTRPGIRELTLGRARGLVEFVLGSSINLEQFFLACKHANGTTVGLGFTYTNLLDKFTLPISATTSQAALFLLYMSWDFQFRDAIFSINSSTWRVLYELDQYAIFNIVECSKGATVPKDEQIDRFIALETTAGMFLQKGVEQVLLNLFRNLNLLIPRLSVDITSLQDLHRLRARFASISGLEATVDMHRASDNWLLSVVEWLVPPKWMALFKCCRTPKCKIDGIEYTLPMISTMGNAFTFPLETLLFLCVALACESSLTETGVTIYPDWDNLKIVPSVFGDDTFVSVEAFDLFVEIIESLGHEVNRQKSFNYGYFRESCGGDYYDYRSVRPFHLKWPNGTKGKANLEAWLYIICNRLIKKYITYFGTLTYIYKSVFQDLADMFISYGLKIKLVPDDYPDDAGLKVGLDYFRSPFRRCTLEPIYSDKSGSICFRFLRYQWPKTEDDGEHHYWNSLKFSLDRYVDGEILRKDVSRHPLAYLDYVEEITPQYQEKKGGSYSSTWGYAFKTTDFCFGYPSDKFRYYLTHS